MATTMGNGVVDYNTATAEAKKKLAQNQLKINNDPGYVANEQQRALQVIAQRQEQGLDTSGQQKYLTKNLGYKPPTGIGASVGAAAGMNGTGTASPITPVAPAAPAAPKTNAQQGSDYMAQMAAIANRQVTPFSYDPNSDPAYQAALTRAKSNIESGNAQNQAEMNRRGILNSTITSDRGAEIASQEMGNVETTVLPQLMQAAYQKYIDNVNQQQQQFANLGTVASQYLNEDQRAIDNTNTTASLTGNLPGGDQAQQLYSQLMGLKQQAEAKGITAAERSKLSNQADGIRAMLSTMGVDISKLGSNTNYTTASQITPNIRTLAGREQDMAAQSQTFNQNLATRQQNTSEKQYAENLAYQKARDAISDKQWQAQFDENVRQYGLNYGLQQLQEQNQTAYQQANLALSQDENSRAWLNYADSLNTPAETAKYSGLTANQVYDSLKNEFTKTDKFGKTVPLTSADKDAVYQKVLSVGLPDGQDTQVMAMLGLTPAEIAAFDKQYLGE